MGDRQQAGKPSLYVTSHSGQLSLAILPWVNKFDEDCLIHNLHLEKHWGFKNWENLLNKLSTFKL